MFHKSPHWRERLSFTRLHFKNLLTFHKGPQFLWNVITGHPLKASVSVNVLILDNFSSHKKKFFIYRPPCLPWSSPLSSLYPSHRSTSRFISSSPSHSFPFFPKKWIWWMKEKQKSFPIWIRVKSRTRHTVKWGVLTPIILFKFCICMLAGKMPTEDGPAVSGT